MMEETACPMCGAAEPELLFEGPDLLLQSTEQGSFRLVRCGRCDHLYQNPRPTVEAIDRYYPPDYLPFLPAIEDEASWWVRFNRRYGRYRRCQAVHRAAGGQPGRLLDVGCATGIFLDGMRRLGWEVHGVEPTASAARYARQRFGLELFEGRLEDAGLQAGSFDVITMWDVLEHVHEPQTVLAEVQRLLRPGGLLVMSLPNPDSLEAQLLGRYWAGWDLPRHLNLFRPRTLRAHLRAMGMPVETIRSFTAGYAVLAMSIEHALRAKDYPVAAPKRVLGSAPLRLLALPYYSGPANWFNLSSIMVVFARNQKEDPS